MEVINVYVLKVLYLSFYNCFFLCYFRRTLPGGIYYFFKTKIIVLNGYISAYN